MSRILAHVRNNLVAYVALFIALGGTAYASGTIGSDDIIDDSIRSIDVANDTSTGGGLAPADLRPDSVGSSEARDDGLKGVDIDESSLGSVPRADHATNSDQLGGRGAIGYQRRVAGTCNGGAIRAISGAGGVDCTDQAVFPIAATVANGDPQHDITFTGSGLRLRAHCRGTDVEFENLGSSTATLNWQFSEGTSSSTTVNASGTVLSPFTNADFLYGGSGRLEGQWIFSTPESITTVTLHAYQGTDSCEVRGTAEVAPL
jgi:hypothetical protein